MEEDWGIEPDNIEGMTFGPPLPDGRLPLVLVSDNNFAATQTTQFIVLVLELESRIDLLSIEAHFGAEAMKKIVVMCI